jgi:serine/threonine protein kinase
MNATSQLESIFFSALEKQTAEERAAYLEQACAGDEALQIRIERMIDAQKGSFLDAPAIDASLTADLPPTEAPGAVIGPYKLLQLIGEGGMGVVFMAEQTRPVQRKVALKIIKPGMDTRQVIARFEAERQALALMDHPNIAKVLDAGTTNVERSLRGRNDSSPSEPTSLTEPSRPYFVMELVKGIPLTTYCDEKHLTLKQRLDLFVPVCQAIQHAHQKGIIHRDLKPSNVLVAEYDEKPVAKIIDFGVAKAIDQRLTEKTMFTEFGQLIGTVEYMSPEQAKFNQLDIDTRSDIYSLGVLLYELLIGATPFERKRLQEAAFDEMLRIIREEEPLRPSTRLTTFAKAALSTVCQHRGLDPGELGQRIRGELDWIVMKCLEKNRDRRYEAADGLARDIERFLADEPVLACPPSARYRLNKFARRNRGVLLTASLVAAALIVGTVMSTLLAVRAYRAERSADDLRSKAEASFQKARQAVDDMYTQVAERWLSQQPQLEPLQREFLQKALQFYTESAQQTSATRLSSSKSEPDVRWETAGAFHRMGEIQHRLGQPVEAERAFRQAVDRLQELVDESPTEAKYRAELAGTLHQIGVLFGDTGRYSDELMSHRRALAIEKELATQFPAVTEFRSRLGRAHWFVGEALAALHRREEAATALQTAVPIQRDLAAEFPAVPEYRHHLAQTYLRLGRTLGYLRRLKEYREELGKAAEILETLATEFPGVPAYRNELANVYYWSANSLNMGDVPIEESERYVRRALALQEKLVTEYPAVTDYRYDCLRSLKTLGRLLMAVERPEEAEATLRQADTIAEKLVAEAPTVHYYRGMLAYVQISLGELFSKTGQLDDAVTAYRDTARTLNALVADFPDVPGYARHRAETYAKLASVLTSAGRTEEAAATKREASRFNPKTPDQSPGDSAEPLELEKNEDGRH